LIQETERTYEDFLRSIKAISAITKKRRQTPKAPIPNRTDQGVIITVSANNIIIFYLFLATTATTAMVATKTITTKTPSPIKPIIIRPPENTLACPIKLRAEHG
jgi:hypothetical protein